jgi:hypothetical protein
VLAAARSRIARLQVGRLCERVEKGFCGLEVGGAEALGKPVVGSG